MSFAKAVSLHAEYIEQDASGIYKWFADIVFAGQPNLFVVARTDESDDALAFLKLCFTEVCQIALTQWVHDGKVLMERLMQIGGKYAWPLVRMAWESQVEESMLNVFKHDNMVKLLCDTGTIEGIVYFINNMAEFTDDTQDRLRAYTVWLMHLPEDCNAALHAMIHHVFQGGIIHDNTCNAFKMQGKNCDYVARFCLHFVHVLIKYDKHVFISENQAIFCEIINKSNIELLKYDFTRHYSEKVFMQIIQIISPLENPSFLKHIIQSDCSKYLAIIVKMYPSIIQEHVYVDHVSQKSVKLNVNICEMSVLYGALKCVQFFYSEYHAHFFSFSSINFLRKYATVYAKNEDIIKMCTPNYDAAIDDAIRAYKRSRIMPEAMQSM